MPNQSTTFAGWAKYLVLDIISLGVPCKSAMMASQVDRETSRDYGTSTLVNSFFVLPPFSFLSTMS